MTDEPTAPVPTRPGPRPAPGGDGRADAAAPVRSAPTMPVPALGAGSDAGRASSGPRWEPMTSAPPARPALSDDAATAPRGSATDVRDAAARPADGAAASGDVASGDAAPGDPASAAGTAARGGAHRAEPTRRRRRPLVPVLALLLVVALAVAGYLYATTIAYRARLDWTEDQARAIGADLVTTRGELDGVTAELEAVRTQLATAQERITELADEKARIGDDREAQAQLLDYQNRVSEAAGTVASALDRCVQGQNQLITYLGTPERYDPGELAQFAQDVERLCQAASEANTALQAELANR